jgi:hypothetical protein
MHRWDLANDCMPIIKVHTLNVPHRGLYETKKLHHSWQQYMCTNTMGLQVQSVVASVFFPQG